MSLRSFASFALFTLVAACSASSGSSAPAPPASAADAASPSGGDDVDASLDAGATPTSACAPVTTKTKCPNGGESAIIRGIAHFDPSAHPPSATAALALFLRHPWIFDPGEDQIGGRLHAYSWKRLSAAQRQSGVVPFELDLCALGPAMWSEENGDFNVVAILDETSAHQASSFGDQQVFQTPNAGELTKLVSGVTVSCHADSPCIDAPLDCTKGAACTTITPVKSVACKTPSCASADSFCANPSGTH